MWEGSARLDHECWGAFGILAGLADVAQLVERHLAKVKVAGSRPVVRSEGGSLAALLRSGGVAEWLGKGLQNPLPRFNSGRRLDRPRFEVWFDNLRALSSAEERFPDTEEVTSSILVAPTIPGNPVRVGVRRCYLEFDSMVMFDLRLGGSRSVLSDPRE